ncbi:unnamed protein product [Amoebophrya sp. A120]|nr:unnamed protein product [Amoebophrya sp. A120]|eukprot:GSA120T00021307001.1
MQRLANDLTRKFPTPKSLLRHRNVTEKIPAGYRWTVRNPPPFFQSTTSSTFTLPGSNTSVRLELLRKDLPEESGAGSENTTTTGEDKSSGSGASSGASVSSGRFFLNVWQTHTPQAQSAVGIIRGGAKSSTSSSESAPTSDSATHQVNPGGAGKKSITLRVLVNEKEAHRSPLSAISDTIEIPTFSRAGDEGLQVEDAGQSFEVECIEEPEGAGSSAQFVRHDGGSFAAGMKENGEAGQTENGNSSAKEVDHEKEILQTVQVDGELSARWRLRSPQGHALFPKDRVAPQLAATATSMENANELLLASQTLVSTPFRLFHVHLGDFWLECLPNYPHENFGLLFFRLGYPGLSVRAELSVGDNFRKTVVVTGRSTLEEDIKADACLQVNFASLLPASTCGLEGGDSSESTRQRVLSSLEAKVTLLEILKVPPKLQDLAGSMSGK